MLFVVTKLQALLARASMTLIFRPLSIAVAGSVTPLDESWIWLFWSAWKPSWVLLKSTLGCTLKPCCLSVSRAIRMGR